MNGLHILQAALCGGGLAVNVPEAVLKLKKKRKKSQLYRMESINLG